ncbi:hypothetical protein [Deinococcus alpinitundrae]|uniref:hypothetical protein n=1 Tax=Deinococcus alpinitundrae TaxID=468913 RepID=UPI001ED8F04A|nr:hypothetical protein [Deinococcus alpinitundrae]
MNVQEYTYGPSSQPVASNFLTYLVPSFTQAQYDSSLILTYSKNASDGTWVPVPGLVSGGYYTKRSDVITSQGLKIVVSLLLTKDDSAAFLYSNGGFKIIVIPIGSITPLSLHGLNLNDYNAVEAYYHLGD